MTQQPPLGIEDVDVLRGLSYAHNRANANTAAVHETSATLDAVVETLIDAGLLDAAKLDERRQAAAERREREFFERGMAVALQDFAVGKYEFEGTPEIDCESRLDLCGAACCKLPVAPSREDVEEGLLRWDLGRPYMLARGEDNYCIHMDGCTHGCGVYDHRPTPCRGYDCRGDRRIWLDFERRIVNPQIHEPAWPDPRRAKPGAPEELG